MKTLLLDILPPVAIRYLQRMRNAIFRWGFYGNYTSYADALAASTGYRTEEITGKVAGRIEAQKQLSQGGVLDPRSQPLLAALAVVIASISGRNLRVIDFGGGNGNYYYQMRRYLNRLSWAVVETPEMAAACAPSATEQLSFHGSLDTLAGEYDVALMSSVLNLVEDPIGTFREVAKRAPYCLINRLPLISAASDRLTVQRAPPSVYRASYPFWFFSEKRFLQAIEITHKIVMRWDVPQDKYFLDGKVVVACGLLLEKR